jgi:hypothetical protein
VQHCNDPEALDQIASGAKLRSSVRDELLRNKHLAKSTKTRLENPPKSPEAKSREVTAVSKANRMLGRKVTTRMGSYSEVLSLLREVIAEGHGEYVDRFMDSFAARGQTALVTGLFIDRYLPTSTFADGRSDIFSHATYTPEKALAMLDASSTCSALYDYVKYVFSSDSPPLVKITGEQMRIISSRMVPHMRRNILHTEWMDEDAEDRALRNINWSKALSLTLLSDAQMKVLLEETYADRPELTLELITDPSDYPAARVILDHVGQGEIGRSPATRIVEFGQAIWASNDKELCDRYLDMCSPAQILNLLVGTGSSRPKRRLMPESLLATTVDLLVARASESGETKQMVYSTLSAMGNYLEDGPATELTMKLPGLASAIKPGSAPFETAAGRLIYQTLLETGMNMDMAFEMLYTQSESSLAQVAETCRAFVRGT